MFLSKAVDLQRRPCLPKHTVPCILCFKSSLLESLLQKWNASLKLQKKNAVMAGPKSHPDLYNGIEHVIAAYRLSSGTPIKAAREYPSMEVIDLVSCNL
jgi:hypothetical protein